MNYVLIAKITLITIGIILAITIIAVTTIYFWPHTAKKLQQADIQKLTFDQAVTAAEAKRASEEKPTIKPECRSITLNHGEKTAKSVVMLHGITACPDQFSELGKKFYDAGYNVYIPLAPYHGTTTHTDHSQVRSQNLVDYVNQSVNIAAGLGDTTGVVGISGGGMLATWATEYRPEITSAVILSPFYEPAAAKAPKWQIPFLKFMYGNHLLADSYSNGGKKGFSYYALANYLILRNNFKNNPAGLDSLKNIAVITSPNDSDIDHTLAQSIPTTIATANNLSLASISVPKEWGIKHDIVTGNLDEMQPYKAQLFQAYLNAYEGKPVDL